MGKCKHGFDHACLICGFTHIDGKKVWFDWTWQEQQKRIDELQARVDAANAVIHEYYTGSYQESPDLVVDLAQALKGGEV